MLGMGLSCGLVGGDVDPEVESPIRGVDMSFCRFSL